MPGTPTTDAGAAALGYLGRPRWVGPRCLKSDDHGDLTCYRGHPPDLRSASRQGLLGEPQAGSQELGW